MDDSHIRNRKSRFFPNLKKNRNLDFITSLCVDFYWRGIHLYYHDNVATFWWTGNCCRYKQPDITCITADSATVNRSHCTGWSKNKKNNRAPSPATCIPMWSTITVVQDTGRGRGAAQGECNLIPASPWHQDGRRSTGCWPPATDDAAPPPPAESDNNSQLSITLMFLQIGLSLKLTERTSWFVTIGRNSNNILSTNVSINQTGPKLVSNHHHHHFLYWKLTKHS